MNMILSFSIIDVLNSRIGIALISTLIVPFFFFLIGKVLYFITLTFGELISGFIGDEATYFVLNNLSFVGTVHHEIAHAIVAFLTGAKIIDIVLYNPDEHTLGSVSYYVRGNMIFRSLQCTLASSAPVFCGYITLSLIMKYCYPLAVVNWQKGVLIYIMVSIFIHMTMSDQDIKVAMKGLPVCLIIIFVVVFVLKINLIPYLNECKNYLVVFYNKYVIGVVK